MSPRWILTVECEVYEQAKTLAAYLTAQRPAAYTFSYVNEDGYTVWSENANSLAVELVKL